MIIGMILNALGGVSYFSPTFGRGGLSALFSCEVFAMSASASLGITIQHKNVEDTSWTDLESFSAIVGAGLSTKQASGIKEQLRFKYILTPSATADSVYLNMQAPSWRPY